MGIRSRSRTGDLTHLCSIGAGDLFPRKLRRTFGVDLIAACGQEQKKHSGVLSLQDDRFRDLIHVAVDRLCGFLCDLEQASPLSHLPSMFLKQHSFPSTSNIT